MLPSAFYIISCFIFVVVGILVKKSYFKLNINIFCRKRLIDYIDFMYLIIT